MYKRIAAIALTACVLLAATGCTQMFFYPQPQLIGTPDQLGLDYRDVVFRSPDGTPLHGWFLPARDAARGTVFFLHGNAENISTHIGSVYWLPEEAFNVFLFDYRGYGQSGGAPDLPGVVADTAAALETALELDGARDTPVVVFGQSLGGALATYLAAATPHRDRVAAVVIDSAFAGYQKIVKEKAASSWLTWALQYPAAWTVSTTYDPLDHVADISPLPLLIMHSRADSIIPSHHAQALYDRAHEPKTLWLLDNERHIGALRNEENRRQLLVFITNAINQFAQD